MLQIQISLSLSLIRSYLSLLHFIMWIMDMVYAYWYVDHLLVIDFKYLNICICFGLYPVL